MDWQIALFSKNYQAVAECASSIYRSFAKGPVPSGWVSQHPHFKARAKSRGFCLGKSAFALHCGAL
jgi:hypothetical protein